MLDRRLAESARLVARNNRPVNDRADRIGSDFADDQGRIDVIARQIASRIKKACLATRLVACRDFELHPIKSPESDKPISNEADRLAEERSGCFHSVYCAMSDHLYS